MAQGSRIWWSQWSQCFHHLMFSLITSLRLTKWSAMRIRNDSLDDSLVDVLAFTVFISKQLAGCWLQPLWKILVKWDYCSKYIIYIYGKKCSKPPTSWWIIGWSLLKQRGESSLPSGITHEMSNPGFMTIRDWPFEKSPNDWGICY